MFLILFTALVSKVYSFESSGSFVNSMQVDLYTSPNILKDNKPKTITWHGKMSFDSDSFAAYCKFKSDLPSEFISKMNSIPKNGIIPELTKYTINETKTGYEVQFDNFIVITESGLKRVGPLKFNSNCVTPLFGLLYTLPENFIEHNLKSREQEEINNSDRSYTKEKKYNALERRRSSRALMK